MRAKTKPSAVDGADPCAHYLTRRSGRPIRCCAPRSTGRCATVCSPAILPPRFAVQASNAPRQGIYADAATAVLRAAEPSRYYPALVLIASTGLRKGEALALSWDRVDLDAGLLKVAATIGRVGGRLLVSEPKTVRSRRAVPLSPAVVAMPRKHHTAQKSERLRAANQWPHSGLVFTTELGGVVDPRNLLRVIEVAAKTAGVTRRRRAHAAALGSRGMAGGGRAHQGGC